MSDQTYQNWTVIFESGTDYEADLVRDRLDDAGIPAVVLTQRDHAFNLTLGDLARVKVLVPPIHAATAIGILESDPISDEELEEAAMAAGPSPDAHTKDQDSMLDSGIERINLSPPEDDDEAAG